MPKRVPLSFDQGDHAASLRIMHDCTRWLAGPLDGSVPDEARGYLITNMVLSAIARVKVLHMRMVAETRVTRGGMALLRREQAHGTFPDTLAALERKDLQDPFSGKSLLYGTEGEGFVLYSVGEDQKDDGVSPRQKHREADYDIVWRFPGGRRRSGGFENRRGNGVLHWQRATGILLNLTTARDE